MKVYIGPYKNWIGPYQIADKIFFWVEKRGIMLDKDPRSERWDYRASEKLGDWLAERQWLVSLCEWIAEKRGNQKVNVRIDKYDTWSMDSTLAHIIHPMLVQLKETKHGAPWVEDEDVPEHLRSTAAPPKENEWDTDELFFDRWDWVLDEMIFAFKHEKNDDWKDSFYETKDYEGIREIEDRMRNGFRLFGKYYYGLWD